jgi:short-subunit dehydrogenase
MNIVITGASKGFGRSIAERFAASGEANVFMLCSRDKSQLTNTAGELTQAYPSSEFRVYSADLGIREQAIEFGQWVLQQVAVVDILVNNAGIYLPGSVSNEADGVLEKLVAVNLYSAYHLTRTLLPTMIEQRSGHIFNMCSIASLQAYKNGGSYSITKYALAGFSANLREELKTSGIKVTAVFPGAAYTDSWKGSGVDPQRLMDEKDVSDMIFAAAKLSTRACVEEIVLRPQAGDL